MYLSRKREDRFEGPRVPFTPLSTHSLFLSGSSSAKGVPKALGEEELQGGDRNVTATAQPGSLPGPA